MRAPGDRQAARLLVLMAFALALAIAISLSAGSQAITLAQWQEVLRGQSGIAYDIVTQIRLPRVSAACACGALLALGGLLLQVLLRNPLADPYVLGISGGASLAVLGAMLLGLSSAIAGLVGVAGAAAVALLVFGVGYRAGDWNLYRLLLTGVVVASGCGALVSLLLVLAADRAVKGMLFWLMGDLSTAPHSWVAWAAVVALGAVATAGAGTLNVLGLGRDKAASLGVAVARAETAVYASAALATAAAVHLGGTIGFVGLIVPHMIRLLGVNDLRWLVPIAMLAGAAFLALADAVARVAFAPLELPVGVLTALLGVPLMIVLLARRR